MQILKQHNHPPDYFTDAYCLNDNETKKDSVEGKDKKEK